MIKSIQQAEQGGLSIGVAQGWARVVAGWQGLFGREAVAPVEIPLAEATRADLFAQALHEDSNLELDWLWVAAQVTRDVERRYCLQRALTINPHSTIARRQLLALRVAMAASATPQVAAR
jgi:hypothetical protein